MSAPIAQLTTNLSPKLRKSLLSGLLLLVCTLYSQAQVQIGSGTSAFQGTSGRVMIGQPFQQITKDCEAVEVQGGLLGPFSPFSSVSLSAKTDTFYLDADGEATVRVSDLDGGSVDSCGQLNMYLTDSLLTCADLGQRAWVLYGFSGSDSVVVSDTTMITVLDTVAPTLTCQPDTVYLDESGTATAAPTGFVMESTDACGIDSLSLNVNSFSCGDIGPHPVMLTAMDQSGNTSSCQTTVTVLDTLAPVVACRDATIYIGNNPVIDWHPTTIDNGSYDNCGLLDLSFDKNHMNCSEVGDHLVTLTATDDSGNSASCTSMVTVLDTIAPTVSCADVTVYLDATGLVSISPWEPAVFSYDDNCDNPLVALLDKSTFTCADAGPNTVTLTVTDQSGNRSSCTSTVTVLDTISPELECRDVHVYLDENSQGDLSTTQVLLQTMDNCALDTTYLDRSLFACGDMGSHTVTLTAEFAGGNTANCTSTVTVLDTLAPVVACKDTTIYVRNNPVINWQPTAVDNGTYDNCGSPELSLDKYFVPCTETGDHLVTLTARDDSGNSASCTSTVTVLDTIAPTVYCADGTVYLDTTGLVSISNPGPDLFSYDDNRNNPLVAFLDKSTFSCADVGPNTVTFTVMDLSGNSASCTSTVTVVDTFPPTGQCEDLTVYLDPNGQLELSLVYFTELPQDACGLDTMYLDKTLFTCGDVGEQEVTIIARDVNGNETSCTSTVTVLDTFAPFNLWEDQTIYLDRNGTWELSTAQIDPLPQDACGIDTIFFDRYLFTCSDVGMQDLTITAIDVHGNEVTYTRSITVLDTIPPDVFCKDALVYLDHSGQGTLTFPDINVVTGTRDNCHVADFEIGKTNFDCSDLGSNTVSLTITDGSGNSSGCTSTVTVLDTITPEVACRDVVVYLDHMGEYHLGVEEVFDGFMDNCEEDSMYLDKTLFSCEDVGVQMVTLNATDLAGNSSNCTSSVTVSDTLSPAVQCRDLTIYLPNEFYYDLAAEDLVVNLEDNCGIDTIYHNMPAIFCEFLGTNNITLTAMDIHGNRTECTSTLTVLDTVAPIVHCMDATVFLDENGQGSIDFTTINNGSYITCPYSEIDIDKTEFTCSDTG